MLILALNLLAALQPFAAPAKKARPPRKPRLAAEIHAILSRPPLAQAHWGIEAADLDSGKVMYARNPGQYFLPASNAKLFTTAAALSLAGLDYRFHTTVETEGKIDSAGRLQGDLVIVGRGDPNISGRVLPYALKAERALPPTQILEDMAGQVAARGLKIVDGDLIGDDTYYSAERYGSGWAQDDLLWDYGAPVSSLTFNDNVLTIDIQPGAHEGDKAAVTVEPQSSYYQIDNRVLTAAASVKPKIGIDRQAGSRRVVLWGTLPLGGQEDREDLAVEDPAELTAEIFRSLLEQRGITITGKARARHGDIAQFFDELPQAPVALAADPQSPSPAARPAVLAEHISLPFIEDVRVTNKVSQNLHAELALRLAGKLSGNGGSFEGGTAAVKHFLLQAGLQEDQFTFVDGSGLSRLDLVTPGAMIQLLSYAARQPWGEAFESTLPVAGVDGTLSDRFLNTPAAGLVHAKTGSLSNVNTLSGYGQTLGGKRFVFSILCNSHNLPPDKVLAAIDQIVDLLVAQEESAR